jgi:methionine biosynthesis protein MetW
MASRASSQSIISRREEPKVAGRAPKSGGVLRFEWYNTPNIRFFTIADFEDFCRAQGVHVHRRIALDTERHAEVFEEPNLNADLAIFVISRDALETGLPAGQPALPTQPKKS